MVAEEPVRYVGSESPNLEFHDGQLRPPIGVQSYQVLRANRTHPEWAEDWGWTYNHAPMLAYWRNKFYLEYLSNPVGESIPPGQTLLTTSEDGKEWSKPQVIFPTYVIPEGVYQTEGKPRLARGTDAVMHQRMGFYVAPNGLLLVLAFYGICSHLRDLPNDGRGIGRVVREVNADGTLGPIYFLRYNRHAGWNETNTHYPHYTTAQGVGFVAACNALLADRLATLQWWEEDRSPDGFYAVEGYKALSYYHLSDERVVGLWKWSKAAISADEGETWSVVADVPSLVMAGGKIWGQRTSDGRYALVYNPNPDGLYRWPLAMVTGDGSRFDHLLRVQGEVPPRRYIGKGKDFGPQYVRGVAEGNGMPPDGDLWITYSMNKEDIWVSRIPIPVRYQAHGPVHDTFDHLVPGGVVVDWNIYSPRWAPVAVVPFPSATSKSLELRDADPYDCAKAERVFPESSQVTVSFDLLARQSETGQLQIEVVNARSLVAVRLVFSAAGRVTVTDAHHLTDLGAYVPGSWYHVRLALDGTEQRYGLSINDRPPTSGAFLDTTVSTVERVLFRTGPTRIQPTLQTDRDAGVDLPHADEPVGEAVFYINRLATTNHRPA